MVETTINTCLACQAVTNTSNLEPLKPNQLPAAPWEEISLDFLGPLPSGEHLLVAMDDYSRFPKVEIVSSTSSKVVIPKLQMFARQGIPHAVKSDNGPPFNGQDFNDFSKHLGFKHCRITPLWPRANGGEEHFMGPLMKVIRTAHVSERTSTNNFTNS